MRWVSLEAARDSAADALKRFPLPLLSAWAAAALSDWQVLDEGKHPQLLAATWAATLGIPLFFALTLFSERFNPRQSAPAQTPRRLIEAIALLGLVLLAVLWPHWTEAIQIRRYVQLSLLTHALVAFLPYLGVREPNGFWQYNRTLLMRLIVASIFSSVLLGGLEGAIAALKPLFGVNVSPKVFFLLTSSVYFIFHPWFFLAGIPRDLSTLEQRTDYPTGIKVFAQFILVPLVAIYQALLTAYLVKVIFTQQWPKGLIGWLVSSEAIFGILAILLIHPVRQREENRWVRTFARGFYIALVPSIVMLAFSIGKRVGQYGVTEDRYFVMVLTGWLAVISAYFILKRDGDIRTIPITLAALALLTFGGPWGAYAISSGSQLARLTKLLETSGVLAHGKIKPATHTPPLATEKDLSSVLDYLLDTHGTHAVAKVMGATAFAADSGIVDPHQSRRWGGTQRIMNRIGLQYVSQWETTASKMLNYSTMYQTVRQADALAGFGYHVHVDGAPHLTFRADSVVCQLDLDEKGRRLILHAGRDSLAIFPLERALETAARRSLLPDTSDRGIPIDALPGGSPARLRLTQISGSDDRELKIYGLNGELYFSLPRH